MAWVWIAGGMLLTAGLTMMEAQAQGNGRGKKVVSGAGVFYLGQDRDMWTPLIKTSVNLSDINSIKSVFQLRTFDPEGTVFYGDTKNGDDWFVLSLKDGFPLMQICKEDMVMSVMGSPKLNDGKWHTLEVSNQEKFVVLIVDGTQPLIAGLQPTRDEDLWGALRLALGGILINPEKMLVKFKPQMDLCVREGVWLNMSLPWETEEDEMWPCLENIKPGSYFPGKGFFIFNTSVLPTQTGQPINIEFWGNFTEMDGTICSLKNPGQEPLLSLVADKSTKEITLTFGADKIHLNPTSRKLMITFQTEVLIVHLDGSETNKLPVNKESHRGYSDLWAVGSLSIGGILGEDGAVTQFLTGCLEKIQFQGKNLDLNFAVKQKSVYSYSCPA